MPWLNGDYYQPESWCPKVGTQQWTCTYRECTCHLKERIKQQEEKREEI